MCGEATYQIQPPSDKLLPLGVSARLKVSTPMVAPTAGPGVFHTWEGWDAVNHTEKTSRQKLGMLAVKSWQSESTGAGLPVPQASSASPMLT